MVNAKMITIWEETKARLDDERLCADESYNSAIIRLLNFKDGVD